MSALYGKWTAEDIRDVIRGLDEKTGMNGASIKISMVKTFCDKTTLGVYHPSKNNEWRSFTFSQSHFNDSAFEDLGVIFIIRHEYCHYVVDALGLKDVFNDEGKHGAAWKTVCGLLNTEPSATYSNRYRFFKTTDELFLRFYLAEDIRKVNIMEQMGRWGIYLPSIKKRRHLEKELIKKYTKARVFKNSDMVIHEKYGRGTVLDTFPCENKQLLFVEFENGATQIVQNRRVYKLIDGKVKKPDSKARGILNTVP